MIENITDTEKNLLNKFLIEHRLIIAKTGYGKIEVTYTNKEVEIVSSVSQRLKIAV